jgi:hypothetical protein
VVYGDACWVDAFGQWIVAIRPGHLTRKSSAQNAIYVSPRYVN